MKCKIEVSNREKLLFIYFSGVIGFILAMILGSWLLLPFIAIMMIIPMNLLENMEN